MAHRFQKTINNKWDGAAELLTNTSGKFSGKIVCREDRLLIPLKTKKPTTWAVWNDLFHEDVTLGFIENVWGMMAKCPQHIFIILTKRPEKMQGFLYNFPSSFPMLPNVWLGVTAENQEQADKRIPILLQIPAAVRFVSVEPMLGPVLLEGAEYYTPPGSDPRKQNACIKKWYWLHEHRKIDTNALLRPKLDWVICGGESGPHTRPMYPGWARSLRDQCQAAGVPFFFKQHGNWIHTSQLEDSDVDTDTLNGVCGPKEFWFVGKNAAGRMLDGKEYLELPAY